MTTEAAAVGAARPPDSEPSVRLRAVRDGIVLAAALLTTLLVLQEVSRGWEGDPLAYWSTTLDDAYQGWVPGDLTYAYSPAWLQAFYPLTLLPWPLFRALWLLLGLMAALWLALPVRRFWKPAFVAVCLLEVVAGNIILLLAVAASVAMRHPAAWAFVLLTKASPGVALGWYVGRRDWRSLFVALGATAAIALVSFVLVPDAWLGWADTLLSNRDAQGVATASNLVPLPLRLVAGGLVAIWGGYTGRAWTIPVAMLLGTPHIWLQSFVILAAIPRIEQAFRERQRADESRSQLGGATTDSR